MSVVLVKVSDWIVHCARATGKPRSAICELTPGDDVDAAVLATWRAVSPPWLNADPFREPAHGLIEGLGPTVLRRISERHGAPAFAPEVCKRDLADLLEQLSHHRCIGRPHRLTCDRTRREVRSAA